MRLSLPDFSQKARFLNPTGLGRKLKCCPDFRFRQRKWPANYVLKPTNMIQCRMYVAPDSQPAMPLNPPPQEAPESIDLKCGLSHNPTGFISGTQNLQCLRNKTQKSRFQIPASSVLKPPRYVLSWGNHNLKMHAVAPDFKSPSTLRVSLPLIPTKMFQNHVNLQTSKCCYKAQIPQKSVCLRSLS